MRDSGTHERAGDQSQWRRKIRWIPFIALFSLLNSCGHYNDPKDAVQCIQNLLYRGELVVAHQEASRASKYYSSDPEWMWNFRILDANALSLSGKNSDVLSILDFQFPKPLEHSDLFFKKEILVGIAYAHLHRYVEAESTLDRVLTHCESTNSALTGEALKAAGILAMEKGEYRNANRFFKKALEFARQHQQAFLETTALLDIGFAALDQDHFDEAIEWSNSAYQSAEKMDARLIMEDATGNVGWAYYKMGDPDRASELFQQTISQAKSLGAVSDEVVWLTAIGYINLDKSRFAVAESDYSQSLQLARDIDSKEDIYNALLSLAFVTVQTGQLDQAKNYSDEAISMAHADGNRTDELYALLAQGQVAARTHDVPQAENTFREIAADPKVDLSLRWEAQHEMANLYEDEHQIADADKSYRAALATFETARDQLQHEDSKLPFLNNSAQLYDDYVRFLIQQKKADEALRVADFSRAQTLEEGLGLLGAHSSFHPVALNAPQIADRLHSTILFYWLGEKQSYLWAINERGTNLYTLPAEAEINNLVESYRKSLAGPRDPLETGDSSGMQLYDVLIAPAQKIISGSSSRNSARPPRVIIVPDGSLNNLNFETLISTQPKPHYWIEDVTLSDASSIRMLASAQHAPPRGKSAKLLLIGDPVAPNTEYFELPKAAEEMHDIEQHFAPSEEQVFTRTKATPDSYMKSNTAQFSYIHFVAHGTASRLSPLDSAVVLSKSTAEENSFKLYARDIVTQPIHADLVTISTCYGAGARAYTGEGLVGLSWAFLRAGAHNVIGALWEVSDSSTPQLMDELYSGLEKGETPEDALRAAKLSLLHSDGVYRKAFYWAPFQLYTGR